MATVDIIVRMIDQTGVASNKTIGNIKNTVSAMTPYIAAFIAAALFVSNASKETAKYNAEVRDLSLITGQGAESSSRFLQVLDDFELTAADATAAARFLKEKGMAPTIETLGQLSDEFKKIEDPAQRMAFLQDSLGRGGAKWANVLSQDSDALLEAANSANKYLIKTDEQIRKSEIARLAVDELSDSYAGFKNRIGDAVNELIVADQAAKRATEIYKENGNALGYNMKQTQEWKDALVQAKEEQMASAEASLAMSESMSLAAEKAKEQEEALKLLSEQNKNFLSSVEDITDRNKDYQASLDEVKQKYADGDLTVEQYQLAINNLATEQELASRRMILAMLEQELSMDGLLTKESDALLALGLKWGIYSETAISAARAARDEVNALLAGIQDKTVTVKVQQQLAGYAMGSQQYNNVAHPGKASGGMASGMTWVGENGRELVNLPPGSQVYGNGQSERMAGGQNLGELTAAIQANKIDYNKLSRSIVTAVMGAG